MQKPFTNNGPEATYVDGHRIEPGETKMVPHWAVAPAEDQAAELVLTDEDAPLKKLLEASVADVTKALPAFDDATLVKLDALEGAAQHPRKTLLAAIAEARLAVAAKALEANAGK